MLGQLQINYIIPVAACICFLFFLYFGKSTAMNNISGYFIAGTITILFIIVAEVCEPKFSYPNYTTVNWQRWLFSMMAYMLRPAVAYFLLLIQFRNDSNKKKTSLILAIPLIINAIFLLISPLCGIVYTFDAANTFNGGPLRYLPFAVGFIYLCYLVIFLGISSKKSSGKEWTVFIPVIIMIGIAVYLESFRNLLGSLPLACIIGMIFYYVYFYMDYYTKDALTGTYQRNKFYHDINHNGQRYFIIFDMNGLKRINDELGHICGDNALRSFGHIVLSVLPPKATVYRTGGDEFAILYSHANEKDVLELIGVIESKTDADSLPYGFSYGYSSFDKSVDFNSAYKEADVMLYKNKDKFWQKYRAN